MRGFLWPVAKWSLTLFVLAFVGVRAVSLWRDGAVGDVELHFGWLFLAGTLYAVGWIPSAWYWQTLLSRMGDDIPWPAAFRAYYCGHLGKYVPGKALVPIIRGQMVATAGGRFRVGALAAVYETLVMMGVGAEISIALFPSLLPSDLSQTPSLLRAIVTHPVGRWIIDHPVVLPVAVLLVAVLSLPLIGNLFAAVAGKFAPVEHGDALARRIDARTIGEGFVVFCIAWVIHGLSLWATLRGVGAAASVTALSTWTVCVALPMVAGFLALFAPGGVGVREGVLIEVLQVQPAIDSRHAVAAAFLLRFVGLVSEVVVAAALYYGLSRGCSDRFPSPNAADDAPH